MRAGRVTGSLAAALLAGSVVVGAGGGEVAALAPTGSRPPGAIRQVGSLTTTATSEYQGGNWANPDPVYEYQTRAGRLALVKHDARHNELIIAVYDPRTMHRVGAIRRIMLAGWPEWGGFYAGPDGYFYVLVGQRNPDEQNDREVVAVRRYDPSWRLVGTAYVKGGATQGGVKGVYDPFDAGDPHMTLTGHRLVVHMSRLIYAMGGVHHQVNLTFEVNVDTMRARTFDSLGGAAYSSHSFQQLVAMRGSNLVMIDHGDAYPRAVQMGVMADYPTQRDVATYDLFDFNGETGDNFTGASVTDLISGPSGVVVLGNSIPQPNAPNGSLGSADENRNVFAISAHPATGHHSVRWLTDFPRGGRSDATEPRAVQVRDDEFAVLFGVRRHGGHYRLGYRLIDSAGAVLASAKFPGVFHASICAPILIGNTIYWVGVRPSSAHNPAPAFLYGLDVSRPRTPVLDHRAARPH